MISPAASKVPKRFTFDRATDHRSAALPLATPRGFMGKPAKVSGVNGVGQAPSQSPQRLGCACNH